MKNKKFFICLVLLSLSSFYFCNKTEEKKEVYDVTREKGALVQGSSQSGEKVLLDVLSKDPNNYRALVDLGNMYFDNHQYQKSIDMYQRALKINPKDVNVRTDMGIMYREIREFDKAVKEFRQAALDSPEHIQSRLNLGITLFYDKQDIRGAINAWEDLLKNNPNYSDANRVKGMIEEAKAAMAGGVKKDSRQKSSDGWIK